VHEPKNGGGERCPERPGFDLADVGILISTKRLGGQVVVAACTAGSPWRRQAIEIAWSRTAPT
jgi:hypothetical protein